MISRYLIARKFLTLYSLQIALTSCLGSSSNKVKPTKATSVKTILSGHGPNTAPSLMELSNLTIDEDSASSQISLVNSDPDGPNQICNSQFLSYTSDQQTIVTPNHAVTWGGDWPNCTAIIIPEKNSSGSAQIEFAASDGSGKGASKTLLLTINPVNDGPSLVTHGESSKTIDEDSPAISVDLGTFIDIDSSQEQPFFLTTLPPSKGSIDSFPSISTTEPNSINYVPAVHANGIDSFEYKVCDGTKDSAKCTEVYNVSINIEAINDAPEMSEI